MDKNKLLYAKLNTCGGIYGGKLLAIISVYFNSLSGFALLLDNNVESQIIIT